MRGILWEEGPGDVEEEEEAAGVEEWEKVATHFQEESESWSVIFKMPRDNEMIADGDKERESASVHQDEATDAEHEKWACSVG